MVISHAFLQGSYLRKTERVTALLPPYIHVDQANTVNGRDVQRKVLVSTTRKSLALGGDGREIARCVVWNRNCNLGLNCVRLYTVVETRILDGSSPYLKSRARKGSRNTKLTAACLGGIAMCRAWSGLVIRNGRSVRKRSMGCLVILHVDDMLFAGTPKSCEIFAQRIGSLRHIPMQFSPPTSDLAFCGVEIVLKQDRTIGLSRKEFYPRLSLIQVQDVLKDNRFLIHKDKAARTLKAFVGWRIWMFQTRYDIYCLRCVTWHLL